MYSTQNGFVFYFQNNVQQDPYFYKYVFHCKIKENSSIFWFITEDIKLRNKNETWLIV